MIYTAGHCFVDKQGDYPPNPKKDEIIAAFGINDIKNINVTFLAIQKKKIKTVHFHKDYKYPSAYSDIAIVELDNPVTLTQTVYPICLPEFPDANPDSLRGDFVTLVGYGPKTDKSTLVNKLIQRILPKRRCAAIYDAEKDHPTFQLALKIQTTLPDGFKDGLICADVSSHKGTCAG